MDRPLLRMDRPLLLIDIDGVISLFGFSPGRLPPGRFLIVDGIPHLLSEAAGRHLQRLADAYELVWCSGWEEKADEYLPFALGLPARLPHLSFDGATASNGQHWKLAAIDRYAGAHRALAWIDDAHDDSCRTWSAARPAPTLLLATDPAVGLTDGHADELARWARRLSEPSTSSEEPRASRRTRAVRTPSESAEGPAPPRPASAGRA